MGRCFLLQLLMAVICLAPGPVCAQSGIIRYFERLDTNQNGRIDPGEVTEKSRKYVEKFARLAGLSPNGPISLRRLQAGIQAYYDRKRKALQEKTAKATTPDFPAPIPATVPGFGPGPGEPIVPGFGPDTELHCQVYQEDLDAASSLLRKYDRNKDGAIDVAEAQRVHWRDGSPYAFDYNHDSRLTLYELAQRYAQYRAGNSGSSSAGRPATGSSAASQPPHYGERPGQSSAGSHDKYEKKDKKEERKEKSHGKVSEISRGARYLAASIMARYDLNRNGRLDHTEWQGLGKNASRADTDQDGQIDRIELALWLHEAEAKQTGNEPSGLPDWFYDRDSDNDGQITMPEFATDWTDEKVAEFDQFDRNHDGIITSHELLQSQASMAGTYTNQEAKVIAPRSIVVSEIEVSDDYQIADLDVKLSITHTYAEQLEAYLIGPDGQRVELFSGVGGSDDHFDNTIFDDEAETSITRGRPPFRGTFQPEAAARGQPSLEHFYGASVRGTWQLMIRAKRSDRAGMLHGWSLIVKPMAQLAGTQDPPEEPTVGRRRKRSPPPR